MENVFRNSCLILIIALVSLSCSEKKKDVEIEDSWYSYMHDQNNSGISKESLSFPLKLSWERKLLHAPEPAWPAPAKQDYFNQKGKLEPLVTYDRTFHPIVVNGKLFISSSANNSITCFDSDTGKKIWQFYTDGPNRNAPLWKNGNLYFGSDDGNLYCLDADNGKLLWEKSFGSTRKLIGNGRLISASPIRTGIVAKVDTIFLASGLLPEERVSIHACDALSGKLFWEKQLDDLAPQGYPVLSDSLWYIPNSRVQPMAFNLDNGELNLQLKGLGGDYICLIDDKLIHGVNWQGEIRARNFLEAAMTGYKVIGDENQLFIASEFALTAVDVNNYSKAFLRKEVLENELKDLAEKIKEKKGSQISKLESLKKELEKAKASEFLWQKEITKTFGMIKTSDVIIVGQQDAVVAFDTNTGQQKWTANINGRAYGLAICGKKLYVSTDQGHLYCFGNNKASDPIIEELDDEYYTSSNIRDEAQKRARLINKHLPRERGMLLVCNAMEGDLIHSLTQVCDYHILGVEENEKLVSKSREYLDAAGVYGVRSTIFNGKLDELELSDYLVNVVVIDGKQNIADMNRLGNELARIISPSGGCLLLTRDIPEMEIKSIFNKYFADYSLSNTDDFWVIKRKALTGSGEWTHLYANPSNTVSTGDTYVSDKLKPLWFGQPGPRAMSDRHHRAPSPMFKNGVLIIPKDNGVIAADAYNGTLLWEKDIAHFRRIKISRDAGNLALNNQFLYAVADNFCFAFDINTGEEKEMFRVPLIKRGGTDPHWGYLAIKDEMLFGSGRKYSAIFNQYSRLDWSEHSRLVTSDYLFGLDRKTGKKKWTYKGGVILNPSICLGEEKMFFVESVNDKALNDIDGLIPLNVLKNEMYIVALNSKTGELIWKKKFDCNLPEHILFGSYANGILLMSGSENRDGALWYGNYAFDARSGKEIWNQERKHKAWTNGSHGEQIHRAMIMDNTVFTEPFAFDLKTGKQKEDWTLQRNGHSCGNISGADDVIFFRGTNPSVCVPGETDQGTKLNNITRPGCWINMVPAGGLLLIPEASSGCSCNFPLQMSIVYQPVNR